jgi:hypothetical protein
MAAPFNGEQTMHTALRTLIAAAATVASIAASAQPFARIDTSAIDVRQARQEQRIQAGVARGELTRREARALEQGQRDIARTEARAKADGYVSPREMRQLVVMLDRADAQIRAQRRDPERRFH